MTPTRVLADAAVWSGADDEVSALQAILRDRSVTPLFQPIVDLTSGVVVGMEALARGPAGTALESPDALFAAAHRAGLLGPIDMLCAERALECALESPVALPLLFVNAEPAVLDQPLSPRLLQLLLGGLPFRIVLEYTERALSTVPAALLRIAGTSHQLGNGIALDDVGADPMSLAFLPIIEPDVIKLDMHLLRHPSAPATVEVCAVVSEAARRSGAMIIAEGIETADDIATARAMGAHWGQGWHLGRPAPLTGRPLRLSDRPSPLRASRPGLHQPTGSPFEVAAAASSVQVVGDPAIAALDRMGAAIHGQRHGVVLGSYSAPGDVAQWLAHIEQVTRHAVYTALLRPDGSCEPFPGESSLVILTPDYAGALCRRPGAGILHTEDRDVVAAIGRVLLQRLTQTHD